MNADIVVVGAGVIGLTTAVRLLELGARVALVTDEALPARTSSVAAAVWYPTGMPATPEVTAWASATYAELSRQAADRVPGVTLGPCRMYVTEGGAEPPWWAPAVPGLRRLRTGEEAGAATGAARGAATAGTTTAGGTGTDPGTGTGTGTGVRTARWTDGWAFDAPTVHMPVYLGWLARRFRRAGGVLLHRRINHLAEAAAWAPLVVNAAGLGAGSLCGDDTLSPVRGQLVLVANPGLRTSLRVQDHPDGYTYIHPRENDVVLGGTFDLGRWDPTPDPATAAAILARCTALEPRLTGAPVLAHPVGLRPHRPAGVRLERDDRLLPAARVLHNYGHGGSGVTLSWGCADEVARLARGIFPGDPAE
ncbi:FAD-dependent oxidoreductase [Streptomyces sp. NPDC002018]|uniref:FAD-dependent oxidoreductase n=1 Tax=Streptomyces sp. NPDC002018 TaxID=3364629 RepID=UPI003684C8AA